MTIELIQATARAEIRGLFRAAVNLLIGASSIEDGSAQMPQGPKIEVPEYSVAAVWDLPKTLGRLQRAGILLDYVFQKPFRAEIEGGADRVISCLHGGDLVEIGDRHRIFVKPSAIDYIATRQGTPCSRVRFEGGGLQADITFESLGEIPAMRRLINYSSDCGEAGFINPQKILAITASRKLDGRWASPTTLYMACGERILLDVAPVRVFGEMKIEPEPKDLRPGKFNDYDSFQWHNPRLAALRPGT